MKDKFWTFIAVCAVAGVAVAIVLSIIGAARLNENIENLLRVAYLV